MCFCARPFQDWGFIINGDFQLLWKSLVDSLRKILEQSAMCACVRQIVLEYVLMYHLMHKSVINLFHSHIR